MNRNKFTLSLGLAVGLLGTLINLMPSTSEWEEAIGLGLLFKLRGQLPPPEDVAIVSINGETAGQLGLGEEIPDWPRSTHADLIDRLKQAGASVIAMDIFFKKPTSEEMDRRLAKSIGEANNVLLVAYLQQQAVDSGQEALHIEKLLPPLAMFRKEAAGIAPFVLPKVPVRVSRFWTFHGNDKLPSLPVVALRQWADAGGDQLRHLLAQAGEMDHQAEPQALYKRLRTDSELGKALLENLESSPPNALKQKQVERLKSLITLYTGDDRPYLNFYGPPGSITTYPYQTLLSGNPSSMQEFQDKVIFIGYAGDYQPQQKDGFYTIFSQESGLDLSGVEIAATAFANLLNREMISPLPFGGLVLFLFLYGFGITLIFRFLPGLSGLLAGLSFATLHLLFAYLMFAQHQLWIPWFIPLALQMPLALILYLTWHYRQMRISREKLRELFGYYLPNDVIDRLAQDQEEALQQREVAYGVCLASDAQQYTKLAETLEPEQLQTFLNRYYEVLFVPVRSRGGVVSDVVGDAMLAIWPSTTPDLTLAQKACEAALDINLALSHADFEPKLHTRIGLHAGKLVMGHVGAIDHFEYRAVGDMVNTASRIENLNKLLGTSILASGDLIKDLKGIVLRELGEFPVPGRQQPITLYEVAASEVTVTPEMISLHTAFADALHDWRQGERKMASKKFETILKAFPDDGPSAYYMQQFHERRSSRKNPLG